MYVYFQSTGQLRDRDQDRDTHRDLLLDIGHSGMYEGKNNPAFERVDGGPIPVGKYSIVGPFDADAANALDDDHGEGKELIVLKLIPHAETATYGRSGFLMTADSLLNRGNASHGCIVVCRTARKYVAYGECRELEVVR